MMAADQFEFLMPTTNNADLHYMFVKLILPDMFLQFWCLLVYSTQHFPSRTLPIYVAKESFHCSSAILHSLNKSLLEMKHLQ